MADSKITALTSISTSTDPAVDPLVIVDVSDTSMAATGTTKKVTLNNLLSSSPTATGAFSVTGLVTAGSATITGDLTVDTSTLKVDSTNHRVGIGTITPNQKLEVFTSTADTRVRINSTSVIATEYFRSGTGVWLVGSDSTNAFKIARGSNFGGSADYLSISSATAECTWFDAAGGTRMTLNSTGLGIGVVPSTHDAGKGLEVGALGNGLWCNNSTFNQLLQNATYNGGWKYAAAASTAASRLEMGGSFGFYIAPAGTAPNAITFGDAKMTLDASGNLLVGVTSGTTHVIYKAVAADVGNVVLDIYGSNTSATFYSVSSFAANAANAAVKVGRDNTTLRSINAGGTVNASGADYAEYMTKSGDFILSKGDVAGIDSNGKLTNVFADAVSFVVKSTDPSYVGNDKWGVDLEGAAIEAARQLVDRIAFAGQVPVNVVGAKAGDYIVPVVDGTGIKGIAVTSPTFEQYQIAVGKVIAIDADGRARIIVKVA